MGRFLKKGNDGFRAIRNGEFVDKSKLIDIVNATLNTERQFTCVSRARRFGKSVGAKMLYAYYDQWCGDRDLFFDLQIYSSSSLKFNIPNNRDKCFSEEIFQEGTLLIRYDLKGIESIKNEHQEKIE